jgi:hypothetical protein
MEALYSSETLAHIQNNTWHATQKIINIRITMKTSNLTEKIIEVVFWVVAPSVNWFLRNSVDHTLMLGKPWLNLTQHINLNNCNL